MEETERRNRDIGEYRQQEAESLVEAAQERECGTCNGAGRVYKILLDDLLSTGASVPYRWSLSTNKLPDEEDCPDCSATRVQS